MIRKHTCEPMYCERCDIAHDMLAKDRQDSLMSGEQLRAHWTDSDLPDGWSFAWGLNQWIKHVHGASDADPMDINLIY